jgi:hypothetical protein
LSGQVKFRFILITFSFLLLPSEGELLFSLNAEWLEAPVSEKLCCLFKGFEQEIIYSGKGDSTVKVQLSTNCGLDCFRNNTKYFLRNNSQFLVD